MTTTGLALTELLASHEAGAKRQCGAKHQAIHMVVQFPKDLVDGDDAQLMLDHARAFAESVFGPEAVFADRIDRDEGSRHVVDLFIAPRYVKKTKAGEVTWISLSRDLKALTKKRGELSKTGEDNLRAQGRALQSEFHEYLVKRMGLEGAERGSPKRYSGEDWKTPEQMKAKALAEQLAQQAIADIGAIIKEAPDLFYELKTFPGDYGARDDKMDRCMELTTLVDPTTMFKIGGAVLEAQKGKVELEQERNDAARERAEAGADRKSAALDRKAAEQERTEARQARQQAEREGRSDGYGAGFSEGKGAAEKELKAKRAEINDEIRKAEAERLAAEEDRRRSAEAASKAVSDAEEAAREREAAKEDREIAKTIKSDAEALRSVWETANADAVIEIERQKADLAAERKNLAIERTMLQKDRQLLKEERGTVARLNREATTLRAQLMKERHALDNREAKTTAFEAGIKAWVERKIIGVGASDPKEFRWTLEGTERKMIEERIKPALDAVWSLVDRAITAMKAQLAERQLELAEREQRAAASLKALDQATKARIAPEVVKQIEAAPGASMTPEEFKAAKEAFAKGQGR